MRIVTYSREELVFSEIWRQLLQCTLVSEKHHFNDRKIMFDWIEQNGADIVFIKLEGKQMEELYLVAMMKLKWHGMGVVCVAETEEYMKEAFRTHADGYIHLPASAERIEEELSYIWDQRTRWSRRSLPITIQAFGSFEVYYQGRPIVFSNAKSKELFAYLVDRKGAFVSMSELASALWKDVENEDNAKSYVRRAIQVLLRNLKELGCEEVICKRHNAIALERQLVSCDYYSYLMNLSGTRKPFVGEYMKNYCWAESTKKGLLGER